MWERPGGSGRPYPLQVDGAPTLSWQVQPAEPDSLLMAGSKLLLTEASSLPLAQWMKLRGVLSSLVRVEELARLATMLNGRRRCQSA